MNTCQFCEKVNGFTGSNQPADHLKYDGKVKYGVRHYAHLECFLKHKGPEGFYKLPAWKQQSFPALLLKEWSLTPATREE